MVNKKSKAERGYKEVRKYVRDKIKLFNTCTDVGGDLTVRSLNILEVLEEIKRIMDRA